MKKKLLFKNLSIICLIVGAILKYCEGLVQQNNMENMIAKEVEKQLRNERDKNRVQ